MKYECQAWLEWIVMYLPLSALGTRIRLRYWRQKLGVRTLGHMGFGARIFAPSGLHVGANVAIGDFAVLEIADSAPVYIGNNVGVARGVYLRSANHRLDNLAAPVAFEDHTSKQIPYKGGVYSIVIEDNAWLAANAVILSGAFVGEGAVVSAGAVVSTHVAPFSVVAGNPARVVADRRKLADLGRARQENHA